MDLRRQLISVLRYRAQMHQIKLNVLIPDPRNFCLSSTCGIALGCIQTTEGAQKEPVCHSKQSKVLTRLSAKKLYIRLLFQISPMKMRCKQVWKLHRERTTGHKMLAPELLTRVHMAGGKVHQGGTSCGESSKPDLIQNFILNVCMLRLNWQILPTLFASLCN